MQYMQHKTTKEIRRYISTVVPSMPYRDGVIELEDEKGRRYKVGSEWWTWTNTRPDWAKTEKEQ